MFCTEMIIRVDHASARHVTTLFIKETGSSSRLLPPVPFLVLQNILRETFGVELSGFVGKLF